MLKNLFCFRLVPLPEPAATILASYYHQPGHWATDGPRLRMGLRNVYGRKERWRDSGAGRADRR